MTKKIILLSGAIIILSFALGACTRSASGGPSDVPAAESTLPNPVSTQSQLMKEIITGTQTAMAMPMDATPMEGTQAATETNGTPVAETTLKPKATKTPVPLPTSTQGPPPVVELKYNTKTCAPGLYICVVEHTKDIDATIQASYPWLQNNMELTFKMGPEGIYEFNKYIVVGTAKYEPDGSKGYGFRVTLNIPDSLRGMENIVVRLETNNPNYYGSDFFPNQ